MALESAPSPLDEKTKRTRDLLASFYNAASGATAGGSNSSSGRALPVDSINSPNFDPDVYMSVIVQKENLDGLLHNHVEMAAEIKNLDTDLQMLVYENYNKFISVTDTIKRMKSNIIGMEENMKQLLDKITSVQSKSDIVNTSLFEKREHIEKLHQTRNLLRKVQFIYDLPARLGKCIKAEAYADAVRYFTGAKPIFEAYGDSSFQDCKRASEEAIDIVIHNLQSKLSSESEPIEARADAVVLLKKLNFPVDNLKSKLLEKFEDCLLKFHNESKEIELSESDGLPKASIREFSKTVHAYLIIFPDSESRLIRLAQDFFIKRYGIIQQQIKKGISAAHLLLMLRDIWEDVNIMVEVLPEATLLFQIVEAASGICKQYILAAFSNLLQEISELFKTHSRPTEQSEESPLHIALESSKKAILQGSMNMLVEFRQLLDDNLELLVNLRDLIREWVQEGFQYFFQKLDQNFFILSRSGRPSTTESSLNDLVYTERVRTGLVLVLAQLSVYIEQVVIPRVTEEIATSFSGGGVRAYDHGPAFVPGEFCRLFHSAGEKFLHLYVSMKSQNISIILKKRFTTPIWIKHKEPREVNMFVDLLLQELDGLLAEVRQVLQHGLLRRHHRSDSNGSTNSSRSNPMHEDKLGRSNTQRVKSQFLESHLAKLFEQKMEIFTKVEYTQESVVSTVVKLCLKSLQEFVRLQTLNRSGYQQIQLDVEFLKNPLKQYVDDEAATNFLLKEVINAAHERCLDPIPLELPILDKLINAKLNKRQGSEIKFLPSN
ncbi:Exocyst complex component 2 [Apostasia shenzhenica]|uniref:Vacuolar protein sorting-associated protein 51 homolog n=1 Tax=Apostasia shenzhenica TaxID=1088818 RepID=A0A2I0B0N5_9ASPA|nr:Exocyst complex component 2 [Apostasia shenzhenica]